MVNRKVNCAQRGLIGFIALFLSLLAGCDQFFSDKPTVIQTNEIFRELSQVNVVADVNRPFPPNYTPEPLIVEEANSVMLFYFTRQMPPQILMDLLKEQLGAKASKNDATNQIVITCKTVDEANGIVEFLDQVDVAPIQIRVDCIISEVYADLTLDYETTTMIEDLFGEDITIESFFPGASARAPDRRAMGFKAGITRDDFQAIIDILESRGYAKILMRPSVEVINGTKARIETNEEVPIPEQILSGGDIITTIQYKEVVDFLEVIPHVYSDGTIGLTTAAGISSRTVPEGVTQAPIITKREITNEENRLRKGQSLVVGGIIKTERVSVVRGVPLLRDIPLLGIIFSSRDFEDRAKEILFVLTPSVSSMGIDHSRVVETIRQRHVKPEYKRGIEEFLTDPLGITAYTEQVEMQAAEAQFERLRAEIQRTEALVEVDEVKAKLLETVEEVAAERAKADKLRADAQKAREQAETSKAEAEKALTAAQKTNLEAEKMMAEAKKIQSDAKKAKADAEKAKTEPEKAKADAETTKQQAETGTEQPAGKPPQTETQPPPKEAQPQAPAAKAETQPAPQEPKPQAPPAETQTSAASDQPQPAPAEPKPQAPAAKTETPAASDQPQPAPAKTEPEQAPAPSEAPSQPEEKKISADNAAPEDANAPEADPNRPAQPTPAQTPTSPDGSTTGAKGKTENNTPS